MSMVMWTEFQEEVEGRKTFSDSTGFFTYKISDNEMLINNFFIPKKYRGKGLGWKYLHQMKNIAALNNCKVLSCIIYENQPYKEKLLNMYIGKAGFKKDKETEAFITLYKEL